LPGSSLKQRLRLVSDTTAPRQARDFLNGSCAAWGVAHFTEIGGLLLSELVSNAVRHAGGDIEVLLELADDRLLIQVRDGGDGVPAVVPPTLRTIGGNGMDIVSRLAESWGVTPVPGGGKNVWCVVASNA
jgi:anti-sigma regulatory factor (Ser/Thr protein kinase)